MKKIDLKRLAQRQMFVTFGFAPALASIVLLESSEDCGVCVALSWAVRGKGYSWCIGFPVERDEAYDLQEVML